MSLSKKEAIKLLKGLSACNPSIQQLSQYRTVKQMWKNATVGELVWLLDQLIMGEEYAAELENIPNKEYWKRVKVAAMASIYATYPDYPAHYNDETTVNEIIDLCNQYILRKKTFAQVKNRIYLLKQQLYLYTCSETDCIVCAETSYPENDADAIRSVFDMPTKKHLTDTIKAFKIS